LAGPPTYSVAARGVQRIVTRIVRPARPNRLSSTRGDLVVRVGRRGSFALVVALWSAFWIGAASAAPAPLGSVAEIRAVQAWSDLENHPIALEGIVTHVDPTRNLLVLQDGTGAVAFDLGEARVQATPGQRVVLTAADSWPLLPDLPRYPHRPDRREWLTAFESVPVAQNGFYVARFRGHLYPPVTGQYHFAIASDDSSRLLLGTDDTPASRRVIARVLSYTRQRDWSRTAPQRSDGIFLEANHAYYIEVVHQQAGGATHLSVAWEGPDLPLDVIAGKYLGPWGSAPTPGAEATARPSSADSQRGAILREVWDDVTVDTPDVLLAPRILESELSVGDATVKVLGTGRLPEPVRVQPGQARAANDDFRWSEVEGTVDFLAGDGDRLTLEITDRGQHIEAILSGWHGDVPTNLRGRRVRVVGAAESMWRSEDTRIVGRVWARASSAITVTDQAPPADLSRLITISELTLGDPAAFRDAAVRLVGRVVSQEGNQLTISDSGTFAASISGNGSEWRAIGKPIEVAMGAKVYVGLVVNSRVPTKSSRAVFTNVSGLLRSPRWSDIGSPTGAGQFAVAGERYVVDGVGSDIWDAPDQFTFVYESLEGAGSIVARLESFNAADPAARAGLMMRESLDVDAQFVDLVQTMESGIRSTCMQWRWQMAGSSTRSVSDAAQAATLPAWLKLERRFSTVTVMPTEAGEFTPGEIVDVVGYVTTTQGQPAIVSASVSKQRQNSVSAQLQSSWRPLVEIARLSDGDRKWGDLDFFRFRGVVTFCGDVLGRRYWAMQDQSAATLLAGRDPSNLFLVRPGSYVEVVSNPGWAPPTNNLFADNVFILGSTALPKPVLHPAEYLLPKRGEGTWIELEGIVRSVADTGLMEVKARGEVFTVAVSGAQVARLRDHLDAGVRLRGVIVYPNERERLLLVPSPEHLEITAAPPRDPFTRALESTRSLTAENLLNQARHRTRLRGTVTYADQGVVYVQDDFGGARVELEIPTSVAIGATVELVGFPDLGEDDAVVLRHALMHVKAAGAGVEPTLVSPLEAASGRFACRLVRVRAVVSRTLSAMEGGPLELEADQRVFRVVLPGQRASIGEIPEGSLVELTGVNVKEAGLLQGFHASSLSASVLPLKLLLRSSADVVVLQKPSWWVVKRALLVVSFFGLAAVVASVWIHRLRQRVKQRTAELDATMGKLQKEARMSATLAERDRLAGEIHDSLEQGLNGILLQLESTANLESCPPEIRSGLRLACNMASFSRTEVQNAVWELQSPMLEDSELPVAVEKIMRQITPESLHGTVRVEGSPRRLPSVVEHHLLRIAQEAINNTVKHAAARNVDVVLRYEADAVMLRVTDDGCGFNPDQVRTGGLGHFGLRSLRSRVGKIHATHEVISSPGKGTTIRVHVPAANP
jgi:signal transduction histidine kinase